MTFSRNDDRLIDYGEEPKPESTINSLTQDREVLDKPADRDPVTTIAVRPNLSVNLTKFPLMNEPRWYNPELRVIPRAVAGFLKPRLPESCRILTD